MRRLVVTALVTLAAAGPVGAQSGLLSLSRDLAADAVAALPRVPSANSRWVIQDIMVDEFSDESGQSAYLLGRNRQLVLIVGCSEGRATSVAIGGLGGNVLFGPRVPDVIFENGRVDFRWGGGDVFSHDWVAAGELLGLPAQDVPRFWTAAAPQDRLRVRTTAVGSTIVQDEFNLLNMVVSSMRVRLRDLDHCEGPRELVCER